MPNTSLLMWQEWMCCWTSLTDLLFVQWHTISHLTAVWTYRGAQHAQRLLSSSKILYFCFVVHQSPFSIFTYSYNCWCIKSVFFIFLFFCILEHMSPSDASDLFWWRAEISFINTSPPLRALYLMVEGNMKAPWIQGASSTGQPRTGHKPGGDVCQEGPCPGAFCSSSTLNPLPADVSVSLSLTSFLNYTSEGEHILLGSGRITSAQSRRRSLSVGMRWI